MGGPDMGPLFLLKDGVHEGDAPFDFTAVYLA